MPEIILHIGCGKTATTFLQNGLFSHHPGLHYLGRPYSQSGRDPVWARIHDLIHKDEQELDLNLFRQGLATEKQGAGTRPIVLSEEKLAAAPMPTQLAGRLNDIFGPAIILITIRSQLTAIPSHFAQHGWELKGVPEPWNGKPVTFESWFDNARKQVRPNYLHSIDYALLARAFASVFGESAIRFLLYEDLRSDPSAIAKSLSDILHIDPVETKGLLADSKKVNRRPSARAASYNRIRRLTASVPLGQFVPAFVRKAFHTFLAKGRPEETTLSQEQIRQIDNRYADGNREISGRYGLDLESYGYPT